MHIGKPHTQLNSVAWIPYDVETRIIELSLQNPDFSAKLLSWLLREKDIDVSISSVYSILKRHGLQNSEKRLVRVKVKQAVEALRSKQKEPPPLRQERREKVPHRHVLPVSKAHARIGVRGSWALTTLNIVLLVLLAGSGFYAVRSVRNVMREPQTVSATAPSPIDQVADAATVNDPPPLNDYRVIWERNLFNVPKDQAPAPEKKIDTDKLAPAKKGLGLELVGTVVAKDPRMNRAFINNQRTGNQEAYGEGDKAGEIRIKKVLRKRVIIATAEGDRLLMAELGGDIGSSSPAAFAQPSTGIQVYPQQVAGRRAPGRAYSLAYKEVAASLANIDELEQQLDISPYVKNDQPAGFMISSIPKQSILRKMGFKNRDAIMEVNGQAITGPDQAEEFFQTLKQGGEMTVKVKKGRGVRRRTRYIHININ